jgi:lincosamide nucleotidyltransferase A/C/D/E
VRPSEVTSLYLDMAAHGVPLWLMGGWGIDALLGRQTRDHHDLDVLVDETNLERCRQRLGNLGFEFRYVWDDETWWVRDPSWSRQEEQPTAFVYGSQDAREVDVHVFRIDGGGGATALWTSPYPLTAAGLQGRGVIAGHAVRCITAEMQRLAHTGYELPPHHEVDMQLLEAAMS